jgi:universal stress protein A
MPALLVAVDGSVRASGVLKVGARVAQAMHARVVLYRAIDIPPDFPPAAATIAADPLPAYLEREARAELAALIAEVPEIHCEPLVEQAVQAWRAILAASDKMAATLIVIGSHGYHGWDRLLGTTAGKVANLATRNVLVVHELDSRPPASPD